jgi:hypothetical protein
MALRGRSNP